MIFFDKITKNPGLKKMFCGAGGGGCRKGVNKIFLTKIPNLKNYFFGGATGLGGWGGTKFSNWPRNQI